MTREIYIDRRRLLRAAAGVGTAAALAGCTDSIPGLSGGSGGGGPVATIEAFAAGYRNDDYDAVLATFHPDSPIRDQGSKDSVNRYSITVETATVTEQSSSRATVEATLKMSSSGSTRTQEATFVLRMYEGEWKIWNIKMSG